MTPEQKEAFRRVPCPCTLTQQDDTCPVGYPSMLCEDCQGKGTVPLHGKVHERMLDALAASQPAPAAEGEVSTYYTEGKNAQWVESLSNKDLAQALEEASQDINDSDENVSDWMPVSAFLSEAAIRLEAAPAVDTGQAVEALGNFDPKDDEAIAWATSNLHGLRRDDGMIEYTLAAVVRAYQAGKAAADNGLAVAWRWRIIPKCNDGRFSDWIVGTKRPGMSGCLEIRPLVDAHPTPLDAERVREDE